MDLKSKIILIYGPTASGKSKSALKLAEKINGEIINADSMQVYKELKILSARPLKKDCQKIKHYLYGFQSVKKDFSAGDWLKLANQNILIIKRKKKIPILVGGTGLYFKALTDGLVKIPKIPIKFRNKIRSLHKKIGQEKFFSKLINIDPLIKNNINKFDTQRSIRAYEIKTFTKKSMINWFKDTKPYFNDDVFYKIYLDSPRDEIIKKIYLRTHQMIKNGAIKEVKNFLKLKVSKKKTANKAIGITEIKEFLEKKISISVVIERIAVKTRQYAKRQTTWGRGKMSDWTRISPKNSSKFLKKFR